MNTVGGKVSVRCAMESGAFFSVHLKNLLAQGNGCF